MKFFKQQKKAYENGELKISKEKLNEFESQLRLRGYWGENKIVQFSDGAIDVYISGAVLTFASSLGIGTILKYIPKISKYSGVLGALGGTLLGGLKAINNGVIIYFKKQVVRGYYKGSPTGGYVTKYIYQHWRHQQSMIKIITLIITLTFCILFSYYPKEANKAIKISLLNMSIIINNIILINIYNKRL